MTIQIITANSLRYMRWMPANSVDLVFGSPPYENMRKPAGRRVGMEWVRWFLPFVLAAVRVSKGLVIFVIAGKCEKGYYHPVAETIEYALWKRNVRLWRPCIFTKNGTPGSGGRQGFRNDWEFVIQATSCLGELPWANNLACGGPPKYPRGGTMSNRRQDGTRVNQSSGRTKAQRRAPLPKICTPSNVVHCAVGGGNMGHPLAHKNEAPFPERLAERFILTYCPPNGTVLDPFSGSGTTAAVALHYGRNCIAIDRRASQTALANSRLRDPRYKR